MADKDLPPLRDCAPGVIYLLGSGETSTLGGLVFDAAFKELAVRPPHVAILETPAGFELNSDKVAGRVGAYISTHLQNYSPVISIVPARKREGQYSPDNPAILAPLYTADVIFLGPGSPTYAVRQLRDSLAWQVMLARHQLGATLVLASAAVIAFGSKTLPVYEIYKAGHDLFWSDGLDLFRLFGASLVFMPHWNNQDGGKELDTSHCFMGQPRFAQLEKMLPPGHVIIGIDEFTALKMDIHRKKGAVIGDGCITIIGSGRFSQKKPGDVFSFDELGFGECLDPAIPQGVWEAVVQENEKKNAPPDDRAPEEVTALVDQREAARQRRDWAAADDIRAQIAAHGWQVMDTNDGPRLERSAK